VLFPQRAASAAVASATSTPDFLLGVSILSKALRTFYQGRSGAPKIDDHDAMRRCHCGGLDEGIRRAHVIDNRTAGIAR